MQGLCLPAGGRGIFSAHRMLWKLLGQRQKEMETSVCVCVLREAATRPPRWEWRFGRAERGGGGGGGSFSGHNVMKKQIISSAR